MRKTITLADAIQGLGFFEDDCTIYAVEPWTEDSQVIVTRELESDSASVETLELGAKYFLEVSIAREFLESWRENIDEEPTLSQQCLRLIHYAISDA